MNVPFLVLGVGVLAVIGLRARAAAPAAESGPVETPSTPNRVTASSVAVRDPMRMVDPAPARETTVAVYDRTRFQSVSYGGTKTAPSVVAGSGPTKLGGTAYSPAGASHVPAGQQTPADGAGASVAPIAGLRAALPVSPVGALEFGTGAGYQGGQAF